MVETKKGDKVFEFNYPITGKHHIEVKAKHLSDSMDLEKVNEKYKEYESDTMKILHSELKEIKKVRNY